MRYLDMVIKESLRLFPPVPFIGRLLEEELEISESLTRLSFKITNRSPLTDARQTIPANSNFSINLLVMFRDPNVFHRPNDFLPERFDSDSLGSPTIAPAAYSAYNFCPFSAGNRNCIGQKFAMAEMKCTITKILRHFEIRPGGPDLLPVNELVLRSASGMHMSFEKRSA